jgi:hypothetical protein
MSTPVPKYRNRFALVRDRPAITGSVDAARHAAEDHQPLHGQITGLPFGHP